MGKYLLFAYADYYPCGGMEDCVLVANSIEELNLFIPQYIKEHGWCTDNMHYYDCQTGRTYEAEFDVGTNNKKFVKWELVSRLFDESVENIFSKYLQIYNISDDNWEQELGRLIELFKTTDKSVLAAKIKETFL